MRDGFGVLAATGVESEANLPYAGLHQLVRPLLTGVPLLPGHLRDALHAAFGMSDSVVPDRFLTALAALELIADSAHVRPQLVIIDDAQWLDTPTVEALGFIARRISAEPIDILIAVRAGHPTALTGTRFGQHRPRPTGFGCLLHSARPEQPSPSAPNPKPDPRRRGRQPTGIGRIAFRPRIGEWPIGSPNICR